MTTVISCPGKVLIAGGYLVLDNNCRGLVIATPSRFYTVIKSLPPPIVPLSHKITVHSPQFLDGIWEYSIHFLEGEWRVDYLPTLETKPNSFVHLSITAAILLAAGSTTTPLSPSLAITIVGSNDFYSQSRSKDHTSLPFAPLQTTLAKVHKTGLGSSAAMVTSLTSALYLHLTSNSQPSEGERSLLHNLAQYVHSLAQGKIGSGFDVSAACFGSQIYRRFGVECLGELLKDGSIPKAEELLKVLSPKSNPLWLNNKGNLAIPEFLNLPSWTTLILADVDAGSNTPSMVGGVMNWKNKESIIANELWEELNGFNEVLKEDFSELELLAKKESGKYLSLVEEFTELPSTEWDLNSKFYKTKSTIQEIRKRMKKMGELSNVAIEPDSQTKLLDQISLLPGIIGTGVPGAGGYDAIWILLLSPPSSGQAINRVLNLIENYGELSVKVLSRTAWAVGGERAGRQGMVLERLEGVEGLRGVVV